VLLATALLISGDGVPAPGAAVAAVAEPGCTPGVGGTFVVVVELRKAGVGTEGAVGTPDGREATETGVEVRTAGGRTAGGSTGLSGS
jgi:hypothetical protein